MNSKKACRSLVMSGSHEKSGGISVFTRQRPVQSGETTAADGMRAIELLPDKQSVFVRDRFVDEKEFTFSRVFSENDSQQSIFNITTKHVVEAAVSGRHGTVVTYGQTGTGKTFTAFCRTPGQEGLLVQSLQHLFALLQENKPQTTTVGVQYFQLYNDSIQDLLGVEKEKSSSNTSSLKGIPGVSLTEVSGVEEALALFEKGTEQRSVRLTKMNTASSRSHAIFVVCLKQDNIAGRFMIADLAGSERIKRTKAGGIQKTEAQAINKSLASLGNVINALAEQRAGGREHHIPYRDSKLTRLLQHSLGQYGCASILITFSPALEDVTETMSSLMFGQRAFKVKYSAAAGTEAERLLSGSLKLPSTLASSSASVIERLREENRVLKTENMALHEEVEKLREANKEDEQLIADMEQHIQKLALRREKPLPGTVEDLQRQLEEAQSVVQHLQQEVDALSGQIPERVLHQDLEALRARVEELQEENEALKLHSENESGMVVLYPEADECDTAVAVQLTKELEASLGQKHLETLHRIRAALQRTDEEIAFLTSQVISARSDVEARNKEVTHLRHHLRNTRIPSTSPSVCPPTSTERKALFTDSASPPCPSPGPPTPSPRTSRSHPPPTFLPTFTPTSLSPATPESEKASTVAYTRCLKTPLGMGVAPPKYRTSVPSS